MILESLRFLPVDSPSKSNIQIRSSAEYPTITRYNDALDPCVRIEHGVRLLDLRAHDICESIVLAWAVEGQDDDTRLRGVVICANCRPLLVQIIVALREHDIWHVSG